MGKEFKTEIKHLKRGMYENPNMLYLDGLECMSRYRVAMQRSWI